MFKGASSRPSTTPEMNKPASAKKAPNWDDIIARHSVMLALEPRFMFDAAVAAMVDAVADAADAANDVNDAGDADGQDAVFAESHADEARSGGEDAADAVSSFLRTFGIGVLSNTDNERPDLIAAIDSFTGNECEKIDITGISVSDFEGDELILTLEVAEGEGRLFFPKSSSGKIYAIDVANSVGNETDGYTKLVVTGLQEDLNNALGELYFVSDQYFNGEVTVTASVNDAAVFGHEPVTEEITITVENVNDAPEFQNLPDASASWQADEDIPLYFADMKVDGKNISVFDGDPDDELTLIVSVDKGKLWSKDTQTFADGEKSITLTGTQGEINDQLLLLAYQGDTDYYGSATLTLTLDDGEAAAVVRNIGIDISDVNDLPVIHDTGDALEHLVADENDATILTGYHITEKGEVVDPSQKYHVIIEDVDNDPSQITIIYDVALPGNGVLQKYASGTWVTLAVGSSTTFTFQDILDGNIRYLHTGGAHPGGNQHYYETGNGLLPQVNPDDARYGDDSAVDTIQFHVNDGDENAANKLVTVNVDLNPVNQDPTIEIPRSGSTASRTEGWYDAAKDETHYQHIVYEGERGAPIIFDIVDPDDSEFTIVVKKLPVDGKLRYSEDGLTWKDVTVDMELKTEFINKGWLVYDHNGDDGPHYSEPGYYENYTGDPGAYKSGLPLGATRPDGFEIALTDRGGGTGTCCEPVNMTVKLGVYASNDVPELVSGVKQGDGKAVYDNDRGVWYVDTATGLGVSGWNTDYTVTTDMLNLTDNDTRDSALTFTIKKNFAETGGAGGLYLRSGSGTDADPYRYVKLSGGDSFTLAQVKNGSIVYRFHGDSDSSSGNIKIDETSKNLVGTEYIGLQVRDGSKSIVDENGTVFPPGYPNGFEGGVGEWHEGAWDLTEIRLGVTLDVPTGGTGTVIEPMPKPSIVFDGDKTGAVFEGGVVRITSDDLESWLKYTDATADQDRTAESNGDIRYRIEDRFDRGWLMIMGEDGALTALGSYATFTQADVDAGRIFYQHNGEEHFTDYMVLSISNGCIEYSSNIRLDMTIKPVNDTVESDPTVVEVKEGAKDFQKGPDESGFDHDGVVLEGKHFGISDADTDAAYKRNPSGIQIVFTKPPATGAIQYWNGSKWVGVVYAGDNSVYLTNPDWDGLGSATVLTLADLQGGNIRYVHNGEEVFTDAISIVVNDTAKGVDVTDGQEKGLASGNNNLTVVDTSNGVVLARDDNGKALRVALDSDGTVLLGQDGAPVLQADGAYVTKLGDGTFRVVDDKYIITGRHGGSLSSVSTQVLITMVNDAPRLDNNEASTEGAAITAPFGDPTRQDISTLTPGEYTVVGKGAGGILSYTDDDHSGSLADRNNEILYYVTKPPLYGTLYLNKGTDANPEWVILGPNSKFTQADLNAGKVVYVHNGQGRDFAKDSGYEHHMDKFEFYVTDGDDVKRDELASTNKNQSYWIGIARDNAAPIVEKGDNAREDGQYALEKKGGLDLSGVFQVDDPDYYSAKYGQDTAIGSSDPQSGIRVDEMEVTLSTEMKDGNAWTGSLILKDGATELTEAQAGAKWGVAVTYGADGSLVLVGSRDAVNKALDEGLFLKPPAESDQYYDLDDTIKVHIEVDDLANGAKEAGGGLTDSDSVDVHISPVNTPPAFDLPVISTPTESTPGRYDGSAYDRVTYENQPVSVVNGNGDPLTIGDADHFNRNVNRMEITVVNGTLSINSAGAAVKGGGTGQSTIILEGTNEQLNNALASLKYNPSKDYCGDGGQLTISYTDGNGISVGTGESKAFTVETVVDVVVLPVNDAPTLDIPKTPIVTGMEGQNTPDGVTGSVPNETGLNIKVGDEDSRHATSGIGHFDDEIKVTVRIDGATDRNGGAVAVSGDNLGVFRLGDYAVGSHGGYSVAAITGGYQVLDSSSNVLATIMEVKDGSAVVGYEIEGSLNLVNKILADIVYKTDGVDCRDNTMVAISVKVDDLDNGVETIDYDNDGTDDVVKGDTTKYASGSIQVFINDATTNERPTISYETDGGTTVETDVVTGLGSVTVNIPEDTEDYPLGISLSISDPDEQGIGTGRVTVTVTFEPGGDQDALGYNKPRISGNDSYVYTNVNGKVTITYTASLSKVNAFLDTLTYTPTADYNGDAASLTVHINDNGISGTDLPAQQATMTVTLNVTPVNDAPTVNSGKEVATLPSVAEEIDSGANGGKTIGDLFGDSFNDSTDQQKHDVDNPNGSVKNDLAGIVVTQNGVSSAKGVWQYFDETANSGAGGWVDVGAVSKGNGLFLSAGTKVRFQPAEDWHGSLMDNDRLGGYLVDSSAEDTANGTLALPANYARGINVPEANRGGTTRYSTTAVYVKTSVTNVNDAPGVNTGHNDVKGNDTDGYYVEGTVNEDMGGAGGDAGKSVSDIFGNAFKDSRDNTAGKGGTDASNSLAGVVIVGNPSYADSSLGVWEYHDGSDWVPVGDVSDSSGLFLSGSTMIRFNPAADYNGPAPELTVHLADNSSAAEAGPMPANKGMVDLTATGAGGTTRYSADSLGYKMTVLVRNDAPVVVGGKDSVTLPPVNEDVTSSANGGKTVGELFGDSFSDPNDKVQGVASPNGMAGVVVVGNPSDADLAGKGEWQYWNGSAWTKISGCGEATGLYLSAGAAIRFQPAADYNGTPPGLTVRLVDDSAATEATTLPANYGRVDFTAVGVGGETRYSAGTVALGTSVTAVNDAPTVDDAKSVATLDPLKEGSTSGSGNTVGNLFGPAFEDDVDEQYDATKNPDGSRENSFAGVVITQNDCPSSTGVWQYYDAAANGGAGGWVDIGAVSGTNGLYLDKDAEIRFIPHESFSGSLAEGYWLGGRLVDNAATDAANGTAAIPGNHDRGVDVSGANSGGTTRYSDDMVYVKTSIANVNDAPEIKTDGTGVKKDPDTNGYYVEGTVNEDLGAVGGDAGTSVSDVFGNAFSDPKDAAQGSGHNLAGVVIVGNPSAADNSLGVWEYHNGTAWVPVGAASESSGLFLSDTTMIRFNPAADYNGPAPELTVHLVDDSPYSAEFPESTALPANKGTVDLTATGTGGNTRYSGGSIGYRVTVNPRNDAPIIDKADGSVSGNGSGGWQVSLPAISEDVGNSAANNPGKSVGDLFGDAFDDARDDNTLSSANGLAGVVVVGNPSDADLAGKGEWQYWNGSAWQKIANCSLDNGLYLSADAKIRFVPEANYNGAPPPLTVRLVDNAAGAEATDLPAGTGGWIDLSGRTGGESRYGAEDLDVAVAVTAVNDSPTRVGGDTIMPGDDVGGVGGNPTVSDALFNATPGQYKTAEDFFGHKFRDVIDSTCGEDRAMKDFGGVVVVGIAMDSDAGQLQYSLDGTNWISITVPTDGGGVFVPGGAYLRFNPTSSNTNDIPSIEITVRLADNTAGLAAGAKVDASLLADANTTSAYSDSDNAVVVKVGGNTIPKFGNIPPTLSVDTYGDPVKLAPGGSVADRELDSAAIDSWGGATVTIAVTDVQNGDPSTCVLALDPAGPFSIDGGKLWYDPGDGSPLVELGTATDAGDKFVFAFNDDADNALVTQLVKNVTYNDTERSADAVDDATKRVTVTYTVDDGNAAHPNGEQGMGGAKSSTLDQVINVFLPADKPAAQGEHDSFKIEERTESVFDLLDNDSHPYGDTLGIVETQDELNSQCVHGSVALDPDGHFVYTVDPDLTIGVSETLTETITYTVVDERGHTVTATVVIEIVGPDPVNETPHITPPDVNDNGAGGSDAGGGDGLKDLEVNKPVVDGVSDAAKESNDHLDAGSGNLGNEVGGGVGSGSGVNTGDSPNLGNDSIPDHANNLQDHDDGETDLGDDVGDGSSAGNPGEYIEEPKSGGDDVAAETPGDAPGDPDADVLVSEDQPDQPINVEVVYNPEEAARDESVSGEADSGRADESSRDDRGVEDAPRQDELIGKRDERQVEIGVTQTVRLPDDIFVHSDPAEKLSYTATLEDGSPLPDWMEFDPENLTFTMTPPDGVEGSIEVLIHAEDTKGNQATATLSLDVTRPEDGDGSEEEGGGEEDRLLFVEEEIEAPTEALDDDGDVVEAETEAGPDAEERLDADADRADEPVADAGAHPGLRRQIANTGSTRIWSEAQELVKALVEV